MAAATGRVSETPVVIRAGPDRATLRRDKWWIPPLVTAIVLGAFVALRAVGDLRQRRLLRRPVPFAVLLTLHRRELRAPDGRPSSATGGRCRRRC